MTFEELIRETSIYIDETLTKENNDFLEVDIVNKIKSGLNTAYMKICRLGIIRNTLDITNNYLLDDFILDIESVTIDNEEMNYDIIDNKIVYWTEKPAKLTYYHIPPELLNYSDTPMFPSRIIDHKILCLYSAFHFYNIDADSQANQWMAMWEQEFNNIKLSRFIQNKVKQVYTM